MAYLPERALIVHSQRFGCLDYWRSPLSRPLPPRERSCGALLLALLLVISSAQAADRFQFADATHTRGRLQHIQGIPVVTVQGSPEELGEQIGTLLKD